MQEKDFELLGTPEDYRWVPLSALKAGEYLSCIDGRHDECIIAAPGGDVGELVLLLSAVEAVEGRRFEFLEVERCLSELMEWHSRYYMHSDELALGRLSEALRRDVRFEGVLAIDDPRQMANFVRHPRREYRTPLAEYLVEAEFVGCGHLAAMLGSPDRYAVRAQLVRDVILSFYRRMWHGSPSPNFVVLPGEHQERAVVVIDVDGPARASTFVPSLRSGVLGESRAFVVHEAAREFLLYESLDLLTGAGLLPPSIDQAAILEELESRSAHFLEATLQALAPGLPRYEVMFDPRSHSFVTTEHTAGARRRVDRIRPA